MENTPPLQFRTGLAWVDRTLQGVIGLVEMMLPDHVLTYYLTGSFADSKPMAASDIDLFIVLKRGLQPAQMQALKRLVDRCAQISQVTLDVDAIREEVMRQLGFALIPVHHPCLFGTDVRPTTPFPSRPVLTRFAMHRAAWFLSRSREVATGLRVPLGPADVESLWLGFDCQRLRLLDGQEIPSTRELVAAVLWIGIALLMYVTGHWTKRRDDLTAAYREKMEDSWGSLLEAVRTRCRDAWHYRIPETQAEQAELQDLCRAALAYENHFLDVYRQFLLQELEAEDEGGKLEAVRRLGKILYSDEEVPRAIGRISQIEGPLGAAAQETLRRLGANGGERGTESRVV